MMECVLDPPCALRNGWLMGCIRTTIVTHTDLNRHARSISLWGLAVTERWVRYCISVKLALWTGCASAAAMRSYDEA